jgi:hypothetical protein
MFVVVASAHLVDNKVRLLASSEDEDKPLFNYSPLISLSTSRDDVFVVLSHISPTATRIHIHLENFGDWLHFEILSER